MARVGFDSKLGGQREKIQKNLESKDAGNSRAPKFLTGLTEIWTRKLKETRKRTKKVQ